MVLNLDFMEPNNLNFSEAFAILDRFNLWSELRAPGGISCVL